MYATRENVVDKPIVRVVVPRRVWTPYDYSVPEGVALPAIGSRVIVPLGQSRIIGVVVAHPQDSEYKLKDIASVVDEEPLLTEDIVEIGLWMANYYHHPVGSVFLSMLPHNARVGRPAESKPDQQWELVESDAPPKLRANAKKQLAAFELLREVGTVKESELHQFEVAKTALDALVSKGIARRSQVTRELKIFRSDLALSQEQETAVKGIKSALGSYVTSLIDGITGSGKTEVYLQVIEEVIRRGQQVLVLLPEIGLTPQMTSRFSERFSHLETLHSMNTPFNRLRVWAEARNGLVPIVIGTRSAVFTPFQNLGLIVVDEEHDSSYKQSEKLRYSGRDIAVKRANQLGIPCILGSATPSLESIHNARLGRYQYYRLSHRPGTAELPKMYIQDMRNMSLSGGMCGPIVNKIQEHLDQDGQVLVLINRRGYSTQYFCTACGWVAMCNDCDVKLTWHHTPVSVLQCHSCGRKYQAVDTCPDCQNDGLSATGYGTQQVEDTLQSLFPDIPQQRVDRDAFNTNNQLNRLFEQLNQSHSGLLVGTQMLAKGHHLPNVTLVVVLGADNGFMSTDFKGAERTAQLIVQVAGRAGRAEKRGEVWIQTRKPDNEDLVALVQNGYEGFIETELRIREDAEITPFSHMAVIRTQGPIESEAESFCSELLSKLDEELVDVLGPSEPPVSRAQKQYRFQGVVISRQRGILHRELKKIEQLQSKYRKVTWSIDVDPMDVY